MKDEKLYIFKMISFVMFALGLIIVPMSFSVIIGIIFAFILGGMLVMSRQTSVGLIEIFKYHKAKRKGKKRFGYIYQIVQCDNNSDDNIVDNILANGSDIGLGDLGRLIHKLSGILILKIALYDDVTMQIILIEHEITEGLKINAHLGEKQCCCVYEYENKRYIMSDDIIPKFVVPKNIRLEIKKKLEKMGY